MSKVTKNRGDRIPKFKEKRKPVVKIKSSVLNDWFEFDDDVLDVEIEFCCFARDKHFKEIGGRQGYLQVLKRELQVRSRFMNEWNEFIRSALAVKETLVPDVVRYEVLNSRLNKKKIEIKVGRQIKEFWIP